MRGLRLISMAIILVAGFVLAYSASMAQAAERIMYFASKTQAGKPTARPYSNCKLTQIRNRTLWACPTQTARNSPAYERSDRQDRSGDRGDSGSSDSGSSDSGGGMGGSDGGGGMGGSDGGDGGM